MASKSAQHEPEKAEVIEELLETVDKTLDRVKVLYEQFFLGIQKQAPSHLHNDVDRKLRDLQHMQIRNTALRYRFATLQQKFGSYNNYWRRTLRQIENGTYHRNLARLGRKAAASGDDIPDEILAAMPKRMREQVRKDREAALALQARRHGGPDGGDELLDEAPQAPAPRSRDGAHVLAEDDDFDLDAYFAAVTTADAAPPPAPEPRASATPAARAATPPHPDPSWDDDSAVLHSGIPRDVAPEPSTGMLLRVGRNTPVQGVPVVRADDGETTSPVLVPPARQSQPDVARATQAIGTVRPPAPPPVPPRSSSPQVTQPIPPPVRLPTPPPIARPATTPGADTPLATQPLPKLPAPAIGKPPQPGAPTQPIPKPAAFAPSQGVRPLPVMPGASAKTAPVAVESMTGPFPRAQPAPEAPAARPPLPKPVIPPQPGKPMKPARAQSEPGSGARVGPPPGMTDADVNALYAKYVKAKEAVGEPAGPGAYGKLLQTINAQAPKIMEQYKAKGVDFQVVVKDNQVVIRAKPKP